MTRRADTVDDGRYSIREEYVGQYTTKWTVRFCGEWVGANSDKEFARQIADSHATLRLNFYR
jgi:hypothetical protein